MEPAGPPSAAPQPEPDAPHIRVHPRGSVEFSRVLGFSDGLFAIAMTLLTVGIAVPALQESGSVSELAEGLDDLEPSLISFFISFAVIGRYWFAHHEFFGRLGAIDGRLIAINLVYLAFVAFLPFPTDLLGEYFDNPLSVTVYAVNVALISGFEVVLFRRAWRAGLLREPIPPDVYRFGALMSLTPVVCFLGSIPLAFIDTRLAVLAWLGGIPLQIIANRWKPAGTDAYF